MSLICPHCGNHLESTLHSAFHPQRNGSGVVFTNIDGILEIGKRFVAIFEEKNTREHSIRVYQIISLKRLAHALNVPVYVVFRTGGVITVYQLDVNRAYSGDSYHFKNSERVYSGNMAGFRLWIYRNFLSHAPPSRRERKGGDRKEVGVWKR